MIKFNKNIFFPIVVFALSGAFITGCEDDDNTGYSTLKPASPTITLAKSFADKVTLVEQDSTFEYTLTLSEPQLVDIQVNVAQIGGTASSDDYSMTEALYFAAGATSAKGKIKIVADALIEDTETLMIQVGDNQTANATFTPVTLEFEIANEISDDLDINLSWDTDVATAIGLDLSPTEAVDMRLLITDMDGNIIDGADGASFESYTLAAADYPDGDYIVAADIYATINAGDFNAVLTIDLGLSFDQIGKINGDSYDFEAVMTNENPCDSYRTNLGVITKTGNTYTFTKEVSFSWSADLEALTGNWSGDDAGYDSEVVTTFADSKLFINGLSVGWMGDFWGESVVSKDSVAVTFIWNELGAISIAEQPYMTTSYMDGETEVLSDYNIKATGIMSTCGAAPVLKLQYEILYTADGFNVTEWLYEKGYTDAPYLEASISLSAEQAKKMKVSNKMLKTLLEKPKH